MKRKVFLRTLGVGAATLPFAAMPSCIREGGAPDRKPNVLFIAIDDLNDWVGCMGGKTGIHTPNIDRLAGQGIQFNRTYCSAPPCTPSRNSLFTGLRRSSCGLYGLVHHHWRENPHLTDLVSLPEHFRNNGYQASGAGNIFHILSLITEGYGMNHNDKQSWDDYYPSIDQPMPDAKPIFPENTLRDNGSYIWSATAAGEKEERDAPNYFDWGPTKVSESKMPDAKVAEWVTSELKKKHDQPFFIVAGIYRPHIPWFVPQKYFDMYPLDEVEIPMVPEDDLENLPPAGRQIGSRTRVWHHWLVRNGLWKQAVQAYMASVSFCDAQIGRMLDALESGPNAENTIVVLWSDHGFHLGEKETWEKFTLWEESGRVPFIIKAPGVMTPGTKCNVPVSLPDIYPTLVDLCDLPENRNLEGKNLTPLSRNSASDKDRGVITTFGYRNHSVRLRRWRYIRYENGDEELYDHDPGEFYNLAGSGRYRTIKENMATWLPEKNMEPWQP